MIRLFSLHAEFFVEIQVASMYLEALNQAGSIKNPPLKDQHGTNEELWHLLKLLIFSLIVPFGERCGKKKVARNIQSLFYHAEHPALVQKILQTATLQDNTRNSLSAAGSKLHFSSKNKDLIPFEP